MSDDKEPPELISLVLGVLWIICAIAAPTIVSEVHKNRIIL
jgi:hypothetical protein